MLVDYMPLEYSPELLSEASTQSNGVLRIHGVLQRANIKNQNGRIYPKKLLMRESVKYAEMIKEHRAIGELDHPDCVANGDILTKDGWKHMSQLSNGEEIYTLDMVTREMVLQSVTKVINEDYTGKMYHIKGKNIDITVTPNHRFVVANRKGNLEFKTAEELHTLIEANTYTHLSIPKNGQNWTGYTDMNTVSLPGIQNWGKRIWNKLRDKYSVPLVIEAKPFFAFLGLYLAEGHCSVRKFNVTITQNEGVKADAIRSLLKDIPLEWNEYYSGKKVTFSTNDGRLWTALKPLGNKYTKYIPTEYKNASPALLEEMVEWYHFGDGRKITYGGYTNKSIFSVSEKLMDDFHEIFTKLGIVGIKTVQTSPKDYEFAGHTIQVKNKKPLHVLKFGKSNAIHLDGRFISITPIDYDGMIYCVRVPNQTFYCRNEGKAFWSGNSPVVNLRNVSHNIVAIKFEGDDMIGTIEILSTPAGNIVKELMRNGIRLGVSSRGMGSVREIDENTVEVQDDFQLICFDLVSNPSTQGAFLTENNAQVPDAYANLNNLMYEFFAELK